MLLHCLLFYNICIDSDQGLAALILFIDLFVSPRTLYTSINAINYSYSHARLIEYTCLMSVNLEALQFVGVKDTSQEIGVRIQKCLK